MNNVDLWRSVLGSIELSISKANFSTWFKNTRILSIENNHVIVGVPNGFAKEWLENKYQSYILQALRDEMPAIVSMGCAVYNPQEVEQKNEQGAFYARKDQGKVRPSDDQEYTIKKGVQETDVKRTYQNTPSKSAPVNSLLSANNLNLNNRYTFDNFIV